MDALKKSLLQINNKNNYILLDFMETFFPWYSSPASIFEYVLRKKEEICTII